MIFLVLFGVLSCSQAILGLPSYPDLPQLEFQAILGLPSYPDLPQLDSLVNFGVARLHMREDYKSGGKLEEDNTISAPTGLKANLSSCIQFFFDVQEVPHAFAGLSDALYNATTSGAPLVRDVIACTHRPNVMDTLACLQSQERELRDFYLSLHPLFIPAYAAFVSQMTKVKTELDSCLLISTTS